MALLHNLCEKRVLHILNVHPVHNSPKEIPYLFAPRVRDGGQNLQFLFYAKMYLTVVLRLEKL